MNKKNLQTLIDVLKTEIGGRPGVGFNMMTWGDSNGIVNDHFEGPSCGTVACLAGHCALLACPEETPEELFASIRRVAEIAENFLGITGTQGYYLFTPDRSLLTLTAKDAIKVLEHFRDTGFIDWSIVE